MAGSCWRLLAACSLILVAPIVLRGQDAAVDRSPVDRSQVRVPFVTLSGVEVPAPGPPKLPDLPIAPIRITPLPILPRQPGHYPVVPGTGILKQLVRAAGIIFSGSVISIGPPASASGQDQSSTSVTFRVEYALRGSTVGQSLTIHEWAALWASGERYRVGEHVLLFLYAPSKLGLTSPVGGTMGRFAMDSHGQVVMNPQHVATLAADPILGGKTVISYSDLALAIRRSSGEE
jgi:hypothetical protein